MKHVLAILTLIAVATMVSCAEQRPEIAIKEEMESLYADINTCDVDKVCSHLFVPEQNRKIFDNCIKGVLEDYRDKGGIKSISIREIIIDDVTPDKAQVKYMVMLGNSAVESLDTEMKRVDGKWKKVD